MNLGNRGIAVPVAALVFRGGGLAGSRPGETGAKTKPKTPSLFKRGAKGIPTRVGKLWKGLVPPVVLGEEACAGANLRSRFWGELGRWNVRGQRATVPNSPRFVSTPQGVCRYRNLVWR